MPHFLFSIWENCLTTNRSYPQNCTGPKTKGLINIQYAIKNDKVYVIEANSELQATVPFIAKGLMNPGKLCHYKSYVGTQKGHRLFFQPKLEGYAIKQPVFSFNKFPNVNKQLGPEMKSTGESILFIDSLKGR